MRKERRLLITVSVLVLVSPQNCVQAQSILFFDDFNGPTLNSSFEPSLPNRAPQGDGSGACTYLGPANYAFETIDSVSVLRMSDTLTEWQRRGWSTSATFPSNGFRFEARFNTLVQHFTTSIDSFIEAWLIDAADPGRYVFAGPSGANYSRWREFRTGGSIDGKYTAADFAYADHTWYRLVIAGDAGQNLRASLLADDGTTELIGATLDYSASEFPGGIRVGLGQATGAPYKAFPLDVAIDWVRLATTSVPEPSALPLCVFPLALTARRIKQRRLIRFCGLS